MDRLTSFEATNTYGIDHFKFPTKSVVRLRGTNGSGKSSVLNAMVSPFLGGKDPSIIRAGTSESRVEFQTESGYKITKRVWLRDDGSTGSDLTILDPGNTKVPEPATYLKQFATAAAVDPGALLRIDTTKAAGRRELAKTLMGIVPMDFDTAAVREALTVQSAQAKEGPVSQFTGEKWIKARKQEWAAPVPTGVIGLKEIRGLVKQVTERRQTTGATKTAAEGSIIRLRSSLPTSDVEDVSGEIAKAEGRQSEVAHREMARKIEITSSVEQAIRSAEHRFHAAEAEIDSEIDEEIRRLEAERTNRKKQVQTTLDKDRLTAETERMRLMVECDQEFQPQRETAASEIAVLRDRAEAQSRVQYTKDEIEVQTRASWEHAYLWEQLSAAIRRLETLLRDKLANLPVPGLEVWDDGVMIDGIQWHLVNTARKVEVAVQICAQIVGELGFFIVDDCEHLTPATLKALEKAVVDAGYQMIEAVVDGSCVVCDHDHGSGSGMDCACGCSAAKYQPKPLRIEIVAA